MANKKGTPLLGKEGLREIYSQNPKIGNKKPSSF
jgi:hypothetical protein